MKVLHLLQSGSFSGAENVVCQIFDMMKTQPDLDMVYCSADGPIRQALQARSIPFVPMSRLCLREVRRVLRQVRPDVIHAHDMNAGFTAALACGRTPLICHIHNNSYASRGLTLKAAAYLPAARKAKHIFWVCESARKSYFFQKWIKHKSTVLENIMDVQALYAKMETDGQTYDHDVVYLGRLTYPKDPERLMQVLALARAHSPQMKAAIVGSGELEAQTKALCKRLGLEENVTFYGFLENPLKLLHDAKVMVMTSRWEGMPMCALEALSLGVPIVSTPTDGLCQLVRHGENGFLSNDDETLAVYIAQILGDEQLQKNLSSTAAEDMKKKMAPAPYRAALLQAYEMCCPKE